MRRAIRVIEPSVGSSVRPSRVADSRLRDVAVIISWLDGRGDSLTVHDWMDSESLTFGETNDDDSRWKGRETCCE